MLSAVHLEQLFTEVMKKEIPRLLIRAELMKAQRYEVDVTLDPDTLHPKLVLSADRKQVRCCDPQKNLPHDQKRFMYCKYVLGEQSFSSGRFYFEVQVKGKTNWTLGLAKESVKRMGLIRLSPQFGYWSLTVRNGKEYSGLSEPPVHFSLQSRPEKVGVFVDYEEGFVLEGGKVKPSEDKIKAVLEWPTPENHKQLQRFLGFANFYRRLSPAEQNYEVGDRELLAIKLALEEWRHWLEGAEHPSRPEKVGVFVDYEEGLVFFYDVDAAALIYPFNGCFFTERLHPFFGPGHNNDGTNRDPLIITAVRLPE
ncbi:PREDICTED: E3 ubiquitin-protein ligase TRIM21-like [Cyprinodon variegatus]|uniref:E3 ubiquitin-protein ligase TRIM21-like n=1 Tax=Cyprinodon variegatus TaxID=28743 RepID=UPI000742A6B4|nr:PREDICTED: E3 ubiquitin-protein ligase TRIM21-like [Cyprinodon variegatus]